MLTQEVAQDVQAPVIPVVENEEEQEKEDRPEAELQQETQDIILELIANIDQVDAEKEEKDRVELDKKIRKLHQDTSLWRSQALYRLGISIHVGRGASNLTVKFEDILEMSEVVKKAVQKSEVRSTIPVSQGVKKLRNKLYGKRQQILDKHFKKFGEDFVVPQENFQAVLAEIKELYDLLETERFIALNTRKHDLRTFLTRIGRLCDANGFAGDRKRKVLEYYREEFPSAAEIKGIYIMVTNPEEIPSYKDMILGDSEVAQAEAVREASETIRAREKAEQEKIKADLEAVKQVKMMAQEQVKRQWSETYNRINEGFLTLVESQLNQLMNDRREMTGDQRREFSRALAEMQQFLVGGDETLEELMTQVKGLEQFVEGTGNVHLRRQQLDQRIGQIQEQFKEKFVSLTTSGKGHRLRALENFSLTDI